MSILVLKNITKSFAEGDGRAVDDVSLELSQGEILALLGESGSGKTTLLRIIAGFEKPTSGRVILNGSAVADRKVFLEPEKRGIGVVFQDYALFPHLNVRKNLEFGLRGLPAAKIDDRIAEMTGLTGTSELMKRYPHELSGGQKQRIALARALAPRPELILMDEPFSSIDGMLKAHIRKEIRDILKKSGTTALFVTHDTRDAMAMSDRICMLKKGRSIQTGTPDELYNRPLNAYVANFFGRTNLIRARVTDRGLQTPFGLFPFKGAEKLKKEKVLLSIRPESFAVKQESEGCICGNIVDKSFMGDYYELVCEVHTEDGESEELMVRTTTEKICDGKLCWIKPRKGKIHILSDNPEVGGNDQQEGQS